MKKCFGTRVIYLFALKFEQLLRRHRTLNVHLGMNFWAIYFENCGSRNVAKDEKQNIYVYKIKDDIICSVHSRKKAQMRILNKFSCRFSLLPQAVLLVFIVGI